MIASAERSLACLDSLIHPNGLTIAKPEHPVMYLMDNVETYAGLSRQLSFLSELVNKNFGENAVRLASKVAGALPLFWNQKAHQFHWAIHKNGKFGTGLENLYPEGLAQIFWSLVYSTGSRFASRSENEI